MHKIALFVACLTLCAIARRAQVAGRRKVTPHARSVVQLRQQISSSRPKRPIKSLAKLVLAGMPALGFNAARSTVTKSDAFVVARPPGKVARTLGKVARAARSSRMEIGGLPRQKKVALTREFGKNGKFGELLMQRSDIGDLIPIELPCIEHVAGPDRARLPKVLSKPSDFDWVVVTSPEAAAVLLAGWREAGQPTLRVASVGNTTSKVLEKGGLEVAFQPSRATANDLVKELLEYLATVDLTKTGKFVYPASMKAANTLQDGIESRGYEVLRLNTYGTEPARWNPAQIEAANEIDIVTFASPSAVKVWAERIGTNNQSVACIGETSAQAASNAGFKTVMFPENPGMDGWVNATIDLATSAFMDDDFDPDDPDAEPDFEWGDLEETATVEDRGDDDEDLIIR